MALREPLRALGLDALFNWAKDVVMLPILGGRLLEGLSASATGAVNDHGLGFVPRGVIVVKSDSAVAIAAGEFTQQSITLTTSSGTATVSVWVF